MGIVAGLLDGLFQRLVEGIGLRPLQCFGSGMRSRNRRYSESLGRLHTVPASVAASVHRGPISTLTLPPRTTMVTVRSRGMSQKISRHTASAMVRWRASSTEHMSLSDICRASSSKRVSCVSQESASASSLGLKNAARSNRASSSGAMPLSAVTRGSASWSHDQASAREGKIGGNGDGVAFAKAMARRFGRMQDIQVHHDGLGPFRLAAVLPIEEAVQ